MDQNEIYTVPSQDEIMQFQQLKSHQIITSMDLKWKNSMKEQIEDEINRKVREALNTPSQEKNMKVHPSLISTENKKDLNVHLNFNDRERNKYSRRLSTSLTNSVFYKREKSTRIKEKPEDYNDSNFNNKFEYWLKPKFERQQFDCSGILLRLNDENSVNDHCEDHKIFRAGFDAIENFGSLTQREKEILFSTFTKDGFREAIRTGRFQDGSIIEALGNGVYRDKYGICRDNHGPFWPIEKGPLHPTPHHKRLIQEIVEPLIGSEMEKDEERSKAGNRYTGIWRHSQIVFDSEYSCRNQKVQSRGENICPDLVFESRFESGNLRQARRTAQMEYELVLQNDLFTTRHTQWFYFQIQNMMKDVTYKFIIINLLKSKSLYMNGMRILMYSDKNAITKSCGWFRTGHHFKYSRNITKRQCPLLNKEISYYQLEFQLEFPFSADTCYVAHCYPYTYTDLKNDLEIHIASKDHSKITFKKDVLCKSRLGNSCFILTITDPGIEDKDKLGAVITARVHPGETNSSWMMNGLIEFLTSNTEVAQQIRKRMIFKIIPMLNPDGVIIGNYRCSSIGRDLNRNYRVPREHSFPTIFHTKKIVQSLKESCQNVIYCDLHGHSRKHNVFMYGCDSQYLDCSDVNDIRPSLTKETVEIFVKDRIFPWLMQRHHPNMFSFSECQFKIRKCKESTGRVVMWKQFNVSDSFTLETTFSGSNFNHISRRHFNTFDLESIGRTLGEALLSYTDIIIDEKLASEIKLEVLKTILKQLAQRNKNVKNMIKLLASAKVSELDENINLKEFVDNTTETMSLEEADRIVIDTFISNFKINDLYKLDGINIVLSDIEDDSSSSDSDSESQPEEIIDVEKETKSLQKRKKLNVKVKEKSENQKKNLALKRVNSKHLPMIKSDNITTKEKASCDKTMNSNLSKIGKTYPKRHSTTFVSKFNGRSNGGIPCFTEERLEERSRRRSFASIQRHIENDRFKNRFTNNDYIFHLKSDTESVGVQLSQKDLMAESRLLYKPSSDILEYRYSSSSNYNELINVECSRETKGNLVKKNLKPIIKQKHIKDMKCPNLGHCSVYQSADSVFFKVIPSEGQMMLSRQVNIISKTNKIEK